MSGKKEREESGKWRESTKQRLLGSSLHQVNLSALSVFFFKLRLFAAYFYQAIGKVYDEFGKLISLLLYGSDLMGEENIFQNFFFVQFWTKKKRKKGIYRDSVTPYIP